ncbi:methyltransferase domain-containing protein [Candidatus Avelusimicrobium caledoniensis]|uniref:methyltransferase domain-containing protein n=1 Tax=Candidatus Avelusimicrobium caledoniensis TaxID=3416220 RepID=UPI003D11A810
MSYIDLYKQLHKQNPSYGASGYEYCDTVCLVIDYLRPKIVLDFGCGKNSLIDLLQSKYPDIIFYGYDPAIPDKAHLPVKKADLIINTDVLEHIPEQELPMVLEQIRSLSDKVFFVLHHALAYNYLPNGQNAHCTVKPIFWYYHLFENYWRNITVLPGKRPWLSIVLTFPIPTSLFHRYEAEILVSKNSKEAIKELVRMFYHKLRKLLKWGY